MKKFIIKGDIIIDNLQEEFNLQPFESLSDAIKERLQIANAAKRKSGNFTQYKFQIRDMFGIKDKTVTEKDLLFLGGFIEGEGSLSVSIKTTKSIVSKNFNLLLDPEFSITQQANGASVLYVALNHFGTGTVSYKTGSKSTLVYKIDNRKSLTEKVVPFYEKYLIPYGSRAKIKRFETFRNLLNAFDRNEHQNADTLINVLLPLWDSLRVQTGNVNEKFANLEDAQNYVRAEVQRLKR